MDTSNIKLPLIGTVIILVLVEIAALISPFTITEGLLVMIVFILMHRDYEDWLKEQAQKKES